MENMMKDLHELCETIGRAISTANEKIRSAGGKVSSADMDYIDKLTHSLKSIKTTLAMMEADEMDDGEYSELSYPRDISYRRSYPRDGVSYRGSYDDGSYARGRGRAARRDSMGRYSSRERDGYSRDGGDMVDELRELLDRAPDEQTRQEMQRLIQKMEQR